MTKVSKNKVKKIDSDQDGLSDWEETHIYGTDPLDADTDDDGMEDGEEIMRGRNPNGVGYFRDLFIPHKGNGYQPKSLHHKRVAFHLASALAVKMVVVLFVLAYPLTAWLTPDLAAEQGKKIVVLTNKIRSDSALPALNENSKLNQAAYAKVKDMFLGQYFAHTSPTNNKLEVFLKQVNYDYYVAGENLALGFNNPEEIVQAWKNSPTHYSNLIDSNFKEIGVAVAEDIFEQETTVLTAQYFGLPKTATPAPVVKTATEPVKVATASKSSSGAVLAAKDVKTPKPAPKVVVTVDRPVGKKESLVKVEAVLDLETKEAAATVLNNQIPLAKADDGKWQGQEIVYDKEVGPIIPAALTLVDNAGNKTLSDIETPKIIPQKTSLKNQYFLLKNNPNKSMEKILDISSIYFKIILLLAIISLLLNIFIQIKKQHPHLIASGAGLIIMLVVLIII